MDIGEVRVAVVSEDGVTCAADPLAHVAAHLAEADETELHQLFSLGSATWHGGTCVPRGTFVPASEPKPGRSRTSVGIRAQSYALTCGFALSLWTKPPTVPGASDGLSR
ncbi:hypothetical protein GCM10023097_52070 [Streptomyces collinus]